MWKQMQITYLVIILSSISGHTSQRVVSDGLRQKTLSKIETCDQKSTR